MLKLKLINKPQLFKLKCNFSFPDVILGKMQEKTIIPSKEELEVLPDPQYDGLSKVIVKKIPDEYIIPTGNIDIVENGTYDIKDKASANVNVPVKILGIKTIIANGTYKATDDNFDGYSQVDVNVPSQGWKPNSTWWDIDKILEEDTEPYPGKCIVLYNDLDSTIKFRVGKTNTTCPLKVKTSDGAEYIYNEGGSYKEFTHTWDKAKDKISDLGYGTRYLIYYFDNNSSSGMQIDTSKNKIYAIIDNCKIYQGNSSNIFAFSLNTYLESIKFQNNGSLGKNYYDNYNSCFNGCPNLTEASTLKFGDTITNARNIFYGTSLKKLPNFDISNATDFLCAYNSQLREVGDLDFSKVTSSVYFNGCYNLCLFGDLQNISQSFNVSDCKLLSHAELIKILNALVDLTGQTSKTLTLGRNKTKLADDELEIATNKNWVVN